MTLQLNGMTMKVWQNLQNFLSFFCAARWIEDVAAADRLIEVWPNIKQIMNFWEKLSKSKQPSNKSHGTSQTAVLDELVIAKLGFFSYLAGMFKHF